MTAYEPAFYKKASRKIIEVLQQPDLPDSEEEVAERILFGLSDEIGGEVHRIPLLKALKNWKRNRQIKREYGKLSARDLAGKYKLSPQTIHRIIGESNVNARS